MVITQKVLTWLQKAQLGLLCEDCMWGMAVGDGLYDLLRLGDGAVEEVEVSDALQS